MAAASEKMNQLIKKREEIEAEIKALNEVLDSQHAVGMKGPLVDSEGFPRADVDVYSVRHARHQIICLQNDYKDLMVEIEEELYKIHAEARQSHTASQGTSPSDTPVTPGLELSPFGTIGTVEEGSPADTAGVKAGDLVLQFGSLNADNFKGPENLVTIVQHSINKSLSLVVRREDKVHKLTITPSKWKPNKGLLGCNIIPTKT